MRHSTSCLFALALAGCAGKPPVAPAGGAPPPGADQEVTTFLATQSATLALLDKNANLAWYEASIAGTDEAFKNSETRDGERNRFLADPELFKQVKAYRDGGKVTDALQKRQLDVLYLWMVGKQVPPEMLARITTLEKQVEQAFNTFRGKIDGKEVSQNQLNDILRTATDAKKLKAAWEAQKAVAPAVAPTLKELVKLRNEVARTLGYRDFYALRIAESEQDEDKLLALFDELDKLTRAPFLKAKEDLDQRLAKRLKLKPADLMPWHYQNAFFQEPPDVFATGLDAVYNKQDTLALCKAFYAGIGLDVDPVVERSDLFEKPGKTPHAFEVSIDRTGDVRVLGNIVAGQEWQSTMVHELAHAMYDAYIAPDLPWLLREASHPLATEGMAMMFDRLVENPLWAEAMGIVDAAARDKALPEARARAAFAPLQFSRWTQVMLRFERAMYADPDQDLNKLWWDLVEEYQGLKRPKDRNAPDYASKIHLVVAPVYYHNYMMGDLFAAQVHETIAAALGKPPFETVYVGEPKVGELLKTKVFAPGRRLHFEALALAVTGKPLTAEAFARRFGP
ncbi:MAG: M2 family metallopeptidase [Deltaproteobacteria bacterium]|nr:M2 family metallopeptidase [Deltaproteobacteria bacterium]